MTMDRNNRSHKPKGTPEGGRYETKGGATGPDDVRPPTTAENASDILDRAREYGLDWDLLAGRSENGRSINLGARSHGDRRVHAEPDGHGGWDLVYREWRKPTLREYNGPGIHPFGVFGWMSDRINGNAETWIPIRRGHAANDDQLLDAAADWCGTD